MATSFARVEAEAAGGPTACTGFQGVGKQLANGVPEANVGGRAGARCFANRRLVHFQHAVDRAPAFQLGAAMPLGARGVAFFRRDADGVLHIGQQHIARQGGFTRATHAGDRHQSSEWHLHGHVLQVVQLGTMQGKLFQFGRDLAALAQRVLHGLTQAAAGD